MLANQSWDLTFNDLGEFDYYCILHPWMTGKIIVNDIEEMIVNENHSDDPIDQN